MIIDRRLRLYAYLRGLVGTPDISSLSHRIELQKIVYFMREFGLNLPYSFSWYVFGPYSTDLARDLFEFQQFSSEVRVTGIHCGRAVDYRAGELARFNKLHNEVRDLKAPSEQGEHYWLELLAGLHYLWREVGNKERTFDRLLTFKPDHRYSRQDMETAWNTLRKHKLIKE